MLLKYVKEYKSGNKQEWERREMVKNRMKQGISLFLTMSMLLGMMLTGNGESVVKAETSSSTGSVRVKVDTDQNGGLEQGERYLIHVSAQNETEKEALLNIYLKNEDKSAAADISVPNLLSQEEITDAETEKSLEETLEEALSLSDGTKESLKAEWKQDTDDSGNVTARYLQAVLPAGAGTEFDMQLQYRTDEAEYTRKVLVEAKAFQDEQDVTETSDEEDEDNEAEAVWSAVAADEESESADNGVLFVSDNEKVSLYFAAPNEWTANGYTVYTNVKLQSEAANWKKLPMENTHQTYNGMEVWYIQYSKEECPYNGFATLQFQAVKDGQFIKQFQVFADNWTSADIFNNKIYVPDQGWLDYSPFNPDDHTSFAGETIWFGNRSDKEIASVTALFYEKDQNGELGLVKELVMDKASDARYSVKIPDEACSYIQFQDADGKILGDMYSNFYGQAEGEDGVESVLYQASSCYCYNYKGDAENSTWGTLGSRTVYYDASLSVLSYANSGTVQGSSGKGIPYSESDPVYYYASGDGKEAISGTMTKASKGTWENVYKMELPDGYTKIRFAGYDVKNEEAAANGDGTAMYTVPTELTNPCFYGDSGDDTVYKGGNRGGYWDEAYTIRDPEKEGGNEDSVVDIQKKTEVKTTDTKYVNTSFYDLYSDYELNGKNRDSYDENINVKTHRIYQPFRSLNLALSSFYKDNNALSPLYWGNFQNYEGSKFSEIAGTMNLFGYDNYKKFFYENNSMWGINGGEIKFGGQNATQGLVSDTLGEGDTLQIKTNGQAVDAPFFDADFLSGENSKNTVLGKTYEDVEFPFTQTDQKSSWDNNAQGTVKYWTFDSKTTNLQMSQDPDTSQYFLEKNNNTVKGQTTEGETEGGNFFPFNTSDQSGNAATLNYGFGMKMEINFRLTEDRTVTTAMPDGSAGSEVPIEFNFSGDDDVWIFIDGKLALDIGGGHDVVTGSLNFRDLKYRISAVKNTDSDGVTQNKTGSFYLADQEVHTLTMFYMERGLWESNMYISYNFPDDNLFEVEKQVDDSSVNQELFGGIFDNADIFTFNIKNTVTHYGEKEVSQSTATEPKVFNNTFQSDKIKPSVEANVFRHVDEKEGRTDVAYWKAKYSDDNVGSNVALRWGIIAPEEGTTFDASEVEEYLSFDFYFDHEDRVPSLNNIRVELEDENGNTLSGKLTSQNTYGSSNLIQKSWETVNVRLNRLTEQGSFDYTKIKYVKIAFKESRDIYIDNVRFVPATSMDVMTGFTMQQSEIPDYGSVAANKENGKPALQNAAGAVYTTTGADGEISYGKIGTDGEFVLGDGDTASFSNQFRRGSYISLTETGVSEAAFETTWSILENGQEVLSYGTGETVQNPEDAASRALTGQAGYSIEDGRIENTGVDSESAGYSSAQDTEESSIVFRSYSQPDNDVVATKLKAVVVNKVKTGSISFTKGKADNSPELSGDAKYTFRVTFTNVASSSLEEEPIVREYTIAYGETVTITGIPAGTDYVIEEIQTTDGARLEGIEIKDLTGWSVIENNTVHGLVHWDSNQESAAHFIFKNTLRPQIDINLIKLWQDGAGSDISGSADLPEEIYVQIQRKYTDSTGEEHGYEIVPVNNNSYITVQPDYDGWHYEIKGLEKYQDAECKIPYTYRIVEGTFDENGDFVAVEDGGRITFNEIEYTVEYQYADITDSEKPLKSETEITGNSKQTESQVFEETITNRRLSRTDLEITKLDAGDKDKKLGGVVFKLEKGSVDDAGTFTADTAFGTDGYETLTTGTEAEGEMFGIARIEELEEGTYRITETKTASGYSLLKSPLILVIDRSSGCTIREGDSPAQEITVSDNTIKITVSNRLKFELPSTGGYGRIIVILGGLALIGAGLFMYRLQLRRKGGRKPGMWL